MRKPSQFPTSIHRTKLVSMPQCARSEMGKRSSEGGSGPARNAKKAATAGPAKLPAIPADTLKMPHMRLYNDWLHPIGKQSNHFLLLVMYDLLKVTPGPIYFHTSCKLREKSTVNHGPIDLYLAQQLSDKDLEGLQRIK